MINEKTTKTYVIGLLGLLLVSSAVHAGGGISLKYTPSGDPDIAAGSAITLTLYDDKNACSGTYTYSVDTPPVGSATLVGDQLTYANDGTNGYLTSDKNDNKFKVHVSCSSGGSDDKDIKPKDSSVGGGGGGGGGGTTTSGVVILDNTASPDTAAIGANLVFLAGGSKSSTAIDDGVGGNAINILDFQTLVRDTSSNPHALKLYIGNDPSIVDDNNFGTTDALDFFSNGAHLFELNRLRSTADWLSQDGNNDGIADNITPDSGVPYGTFGTISLTSFLDNIANDRTMYGMVRVLIPLELQSSASGTTKNALGTTVNANTIYGFCSSANGLCGSCAPSKTSSSTFFQKIARSATICGITMPATAKIKVKGALLWDFVDNNTQAPVPLDNLPFVPRELYFKVEMPIMVDWAHDLDDDGAMDNMPYIKSLTSSITGTNPIDITSTIATIDFTKVPQSSLDSYAYESGATLDATTFAGLNKPSQYHLLMANGYPDGWAAAFDKLNISAATWSLLPPDSCVTEAGSACNKFSVPDGVSGILTANDIRSDGFEDIPTYLYSGGLIDMHRDVNISGLIYVPQGMELEAKDSSAPTQQYVYGGIVVRDTFFIEAKDNTITVMSAGPDTYTTAITTLSSSTSNTGPVYASMYYGQTTNTTTSTTGSGGTAATADTFCAGCSSTGSSSSASGASQQAGSVRWIEIHPSK